jgi:ribosomal protein L11 methyltransferase
VREADDSDHVRMRHRGCGRPWTLAIQDHRYLRLIRDGAEIERLRFHLRVASRNQSGFVTKVRGPVDECQALTHARLRDSRDQHLLSHRMPRHHFPNRNFFFVAEQFSFARRATDHIARERGAIPVLDVVLHFDLVDVAVVVEWSGDVRKYSLKFHSQTMFSLYVECGQEEKDRLIAELWDRGSSGITESDLPDGACALRAFFDSDAESAALVREFARWAARSEPEEPRDWIAEARTKLEPMCIGARIFLVPEWRDDPTPPGRFRIQVNPGMAFGTGAHESTQLCLEALEREVQPGMAVLDVGSGSGILAVAAQLLGARRVIACDIDLVTVALAKQPLAFIGSADAVGSRSVDLGVANISPEAIIALAPELIRVLRPGGAMIVSGFETAEAAAVETALAFHGGKLRSSHSKGSWAAHVVSV